MPGRPERLVARERVEVAAQRPARRAAGAARPARRPPARARPARGPARRSASPGCTVPSAFETWPTETRRVRGRDQPLHLVEPDLAVVVDRRDLAATPPVCSQSSCQGTMFEWCSSAEIRISSPAFTRWRPKVCATRLIASVVPRTKTISRASRRVQEALHACARAPSNAFSAFIDRSYTPRWTFA